MQAQLEWHVDDFTTHLRGELRSTSADIDRHLGHMRSSAQQASTWTRRALLWPLLLTGGLILALILAAVAWGWGRISGLPTEVTDSEGTTDAGPHRSGLDHLHLAGPQAALPARGQIGELAT